MFISTLRSIIYVLLLSSLLYNISFEMNSFQYDCIKFSFYCIKFIDKKNDHVFSFICTYIFAKLPLWLLFSIANFDMCNVY